MIDADYADNLALFANKSSNAEYILNKIEPFSLFVAIL